MKTLRNWLLGALAGIQILHAQTGGYYNPTNTPLETWSFFDSTNWTSDHGSVPVSFTNLAYSYLGNGASLVIDTNIPAWLQYNVVETNGTTNVMVDAGTVMFWFAPSWSSTNDGGTGPGVFGRLFEVGNYTPDSSYGWWSILLDDSGNNLYFAAQTNDLSSNIVTYLSAPIDWTTNYFHHIALTYCATNTALYLDGQFVTNGLPLTVYPGADVLANGFFIGGDSNGVLQAHGLFNTVQTFDYPLSADDIQAIFNYEYGWYMISPWNVAMFNGSGSGASTNDLWLQFAGYGGGAATLRIQVPLSTTGSNFMFDVFATTNLLPNVPGLNATNWMYVTRAAPGQTNLILPTLPNAPVCFYRLGTMLDSDNDGLTDGYENLVSHTDPNKWDSNTNGIGDGDELSPSGLPWRLEQARKLAAVIYANNPTATQGGGCGQCTVYLPTNAPTGGVTVQYYLGGSAVLGSDYSISANSLFIPAGSISNIISICALGTNSWSDLALYTDITLTNAGSYYVDGTPARVNIVQTGSPGVRVFALPPWSYRPSSTYGTNQVGFYFIRDGASTNSLTINLSLTGSTAKVSSEYSSFSTNITFAANVRTNWLPVTLIANGTNPTNTTLTVTITNAPGYQIDPANKSATLTIAATAAPALPVVTITNSIPFASAGSGGQFIISRSPASASPLRVYFNTWSSVENVTGRSGTNDTTTYNVLPDYVDIAANATSTNVPMTVNNAPSLPVQVIATLLAGDYTIGTNNTATVTLDPSGSTAVSVALTRTGVHNGTSGWFQAAEFTFTRSGSVANPLSLAWFNVSSAGLLGLVAQSGQMAGLSLPTNSSARGSIVWPAGVSVIKTNLSITYGWNDSGNLRNDDSTVYLSVSFSNAYYQGTIPVTFVPVWQQVQLTSASSPATILTNGATQNALSLSRTYTRIGTGSQHAVQVIISTSGSATAGTDFTMSTTVNIASNVNTVSIPVTALNATNQGWRTLVATLNPAANSQIVPMFDRDTAIVRLANPNDLIDDTDIDGDGIPDGFELANAASGLDPLTPDNPNEDVDRDGIGLMDELSFGLNPNTPDSPPIYPSIEDSDYVNLTLKIGSVGKMLLENNHSCAQCHAVSVRVDGGYPLKTDITDVNHNPRLADYLLHLVRGTNYPIQVSCNPISSLLTSNQAAATTSPKYTAAYVAQFWANSNSIYPFIVDTNGLLGTNLDMVKEVLPKRATLYIPDLTIAADNDRAGIIDFKSRADRTAATNPFTFWINDDCDTNSDDSATDLDPSANQINSADSVINGLRDLEDFARLQFKLDGLPGQMLTNSGYQLKVYLTNFTGAASLRLFPATDSDGGIAYLTNVVSGSAQTNAVTFGVLSAGSPLFLSATNWRSAGPNSFFLPMIFEGVTTGSCVVTFGFSSNNAPPVAVSRPFYLKLKEVTDLYEHWTVGDNTTTEWNQITTNAVRTPDSAVFNRPEKQTDLDYIVFVHGWRMQPWDRRAFASTAFKRLWHLGYQGRFGFYSWPTDYTTLTFWDLTSLANRQNYDRSEQRAWRSGRALEKLLDSLLRLEPNYRLRLIAHSMGNIVASEALRLGGTDASTLPLVQGYIASQAASVAHAYDATNPEVARISVRPNVYANFPRNGIYQPYFSGMKNAVQGSNIFNFHNKDDYALNTSGAWPWNQFLKPDWGWRYQLVTPNNVNTNSGYTYWETNKVQLHFENLDQAHTIFSYIAMAWSKALGCAEVSGHHIQGEVGSAVNLNISPFDYGNNSYEHSAEFNSIYLNRRSYWWQALSTFSLTNNLPQP